MTYTEFTNLHPLEQMGLRQFAVARENKRQEFLVDLAESFLESLSG
jgi:hypothetical protein